MDLRVNQPVYTRSLTGISSMALKTIGFKILGQLTLALTFIHSLFVGQFSLPCHLMFGRAVAQQEIQTSQPLTAISLRHIIFGENIYFTCRLDPAIHAKSMQDFFISADSDGSLMWLAPIVVTTVCDLNVRLFPYDTQSCKFEFASWVYHGMSLDLWNNTPVGKRNNDTLIQISSYHVL